MVLKKWFCQIFVYKQEYYPKVTTARRTTDQSQNKPPCGAARVRQPRVEQSATLGIEYWITLLYDSLRVEDVPQELDSSWRQWHSRNIIALTNMSFRAGTPYSSMPVLDDVVLMPYPRVTLRSGLPDSCRPVRACFTTNLCFIRILNFVSIFYNNPEWFCNPQTNQELASKVPYWILILLNFSERDRFLLFLLKCFMGYLWNNLHFSNETSS